jgi:hypothetical protein
MIKKELDRERKREIPKTERSGRRDRKKWRKIKWRNKEYGEREKNIMMCERRKARWIGSKRRKKERNRERIKLLREIKANKEKKNGREAGRRERKHLKLKMSRERIGRKREIKEKKGEITAMKAEELAITFRLISRSSLFSLSLFSLLCAPLLVGVELTSVQLHRRLGDH